MTKPTPEQMLKLAKIVYPNKHWKMIGEIVWKCCENGDICIDAETFEPMSRTALGRTQLMEVVFALLVDGVCFNVVAVHASKYIASISHAHGKYNITGETKAEAILNLAHEVLCND